MGSRPLREIDPPEMTEEEIERAKDAAVEEGRLAMQEGRYVDHAEVARWLTSWGTDHELPPPAIPGAR